MGTEGANGQGNGLGRQPKHLKRVSNALCYPGEALTYNIAGTLPHLIEQRPYKGKLTQLKKILATGLSEAEAIDRAKAGDADHLKRCTGCTSGGYIRCACE